MGWKGTLRSLQAASNAAARDTERRRKQQANINAINQAAAEVNEFNEYIEKLTSFHREHREFIDWQSFINAEEPRKPKKSDFVKEKTAKERFEKYSPGFFVKTLGFENFQRNRLEGKIAKAGRRDRSDFEEEIKSYEDSHQEWEENKEMAEQLFNNNPETFKEALKKYDFLGDIEEMNLVGGDYDFEKDSVPTLSIQVPDIDVVPTVIKKQNPSCSLFVREMPISRRNEIYQDLVCSVVIRVGCEFLAIIPVELVIVSGCVDMVNSATGHKEVTPILSVAISRRTVQELDLRNVDPSDALSNFVHHSGFRKTKGFSKVDIIKMESPNE